MSVLETSDIALRTACIGQLLLCGLLFRKQPSRSLAEAYFPFFIVSAFFGIIWPYFPPDTGIVINTIVGLFAVSIGFSLWFLSECLFNDQFSFRKIHLLYALLAPLCTLAPSRWGINIAMGINLVFILSILWRLHSGFEADLVESRRKFRKAFLLIITIFIGAMVVVTMYIAQIDTHTQEALNFASAVVITGMALAFNTFVLDPNYNFFQSNQATRSLEKSATVDDKKTLLDLQKKLESKIYLKGDLTIRALAEEIGSKEHILRQIINQSLGFKNFNDFLNQHRIEEAKLLLVSDQYQNAKIFAIALEVGYSSLAPFNRAFKSIVGMTPSEFRKLPPHSRSQLNVRQSDC